MTAMRISISGPAVLIDRTRTEAEAEGIGLSAFVVESLERRFRSEDMQRLAEFDRELDRERVALESMTLAHYRADTQ